MKFSKNELEISGPFSIPLGGWKLTNRSFQKILYEEDRR